MDSIDLAKHALRRALTKQLGLSRPYVSELLSGKRSPKYADAIRIETELHIPANAWVRKDGAAQEMWRIIMEREGRA
jgi:transcriptional regulator with XRE-family HTH domain